MKKVVMALLCAWLALPLYAAASGLTVANPQADVNGVVWYDAVSSYNGPGSTTLRVLSPTTAAGKAHRFIYVLPVIDDVDLEDFFGDGLEALRTLNVHNDYNAHIIAPSFKTAPWYADHDSDPERRYESFLVHDLVPWVRATLSVTGQEEHWLIGFSKSGFGAATLLFRNPTVFDAAAAWDLPADQADTSVWDMLDNYGSDANFQDNYRLTDAWIAAHQGPFQTATRLWLSYDQGTYFGYPTFLDEVSAFAGRLQAHQVQFMRTGGATRPHAWGSGWLSEAVAGLQRMRFRARDDFDRADGALGPNWVMDPLWGAGIVVAGHQAGSSLARRRRALLELELVRGRSVFADQDHWHDRRLGGCVGQGSGVTGTRLLAGRQGRGGLPLRLRQRRVLPARARRGQLDLRGYPETRSSHRCREHRAPHHLSQRHPCPHPRRRRSLHRQWSAGDRALRQHVRVPRRLGGRRAGWSAGVQWRARQLRPRRRRPRPELGDGSCCGERASSWRVTRRARRCTTAAHTSGLRTRSGPISIRRSRSPARSPTGWACRSGVRRHRGKATGWPSRPMGPTSTPSSTARSTCSRTTRAAGPPAIP